MATLSQKQKEFIVSQLAAFYSPSEVVEQVKEEWKIEVTRQQVARYNADSALGEDLSQEFKTLFELRRKAFLESRDKIAITSQAFRERELLDLYRQMKKKAPVLAAKMLEQAAKEAGGVYLRKVDDKGDETNDPLPAEFEAALDKIYGDAAIAEGAEDDPAESGE